MAAFGDEELLSLLNTAQSIDVLINLGLTERQARALLEYRQEHGPFSSVEGILRVKGIGERTLARLRLWGPAGGYPRSPRPAPRTEAKPAPLARAQEVLIGSLLALPLYFVIVSIANNGHGAFLAMAVIGSVIGFALTIAAIANLLAPTDSQSPRGSIALFASTMVLGIVLALVMASGQLPAEEAGTSTTGPLSETPSLIAAFTVFPMGGEAPLTVQCDASPSRCPPGTTVVGYRWLFDGEEPPPAAVAGWVGEPEVSYTFTEPGQHVIELTVKDDRGATATTKRIVTVAAPAHPSSSGQSCYPSRIAGHWIPLHCELAGPVQCEEIGENKYRAVVTVNFDKYLSPEYWAFQFIDRFLILAEGVFADSMLSSVYELRLVAQALYVHRTIYGERKEVWETVLAATFPRMQAEKVVDWYECRTMYCLNPLLFFASGLVKNVYADPRVPLVNPSP